MTFASVIALLAAAFARPRPDASAERLRNLEAENSRLRSDNARLRAIANDLQGRLAMAQGQAVRQFVGQNHALPQQGFAMANPDWRQLGQLAGQRYWQESQLGQLGAQTLAFDAETFCNCIPSRMQVLNMRREDDDGA